MKRSGVYTLVILRLLALAAIVLGVWAFIDQITFVSTPGAVQVITEEIVRPDLSDSDRNKLSFCTGWILRNDRRLRRAGLLASIGMPITGILLIFATARRKQNNRVEDIDANAPNPHS